MLVLGFGVLGGTAAVHGLDDCRVLLVLDGPLSAGVAEGLGKVVVAAQLGSLALGAADDGDAVGDTGADLVNGVLEVDGVEDISQTPPRGLRRG